MAHLQYLLFAFTLCIAPVAIAAQGKQLSGPQKRLQKGKPQFPSCNRRLCWSKIARCNLLGSCYCTHYDRQNPGNCQCCNKCEKCMRNMWNYCCDCLKICPPLNPTVSSNTYMSTAGDLKESIPSLFEALSYGSNLPFEFTSHKSSKKEHAGANVTSSVVTQSTPVRCKVGFFHDCTTLEMCQDACKDLGSSRYRWFHNGCCECIGGRCTDYGKTKPRCKNCSK